MRHKANFSGINTVKFSYNPRGIEGKCYPNSNKEDLTISFNLQKIVKTIPNTPNVYDFDNYLGVEEESDNESPASTITRKSTCKASYLIPHWISLKPSLTEW